MTLMYFQSLNLNVGIFLWCSQILNGTWCCPFIPAVLTLASFPGEWFWYSNMKCVHFLSKWSSSNVVRFIVVCLKRITYSMWCLQWSWRVLWIKDQHSSRFDKTNWTLAFVDTFFVCFSTDSFKTCLRKNPVTPKKTRENVYDNSMGPCLFLPAIIIIIMGP